MAIGRSCFQTFTGHRVDVLRPTPEHVHVVDLVHSLSMQCRFNGHCQFFYSVAQHSCLVADVVIRYFQEARYELLALLHDATEAFVGDMIKPLKDVDGMGTFRTLEFEWALAIGDRFGLGDQLAYLPDVVKAADTMMLHRERVDILAPGYGRSLSLEQVDQRIPVVEPLSQAAARQLFSERLMRTLPIASVDRRLFDLTLG